MDSHKDNYPLETKKIRCRQCDHYRKFVRFNFIREPVYLLVQTSSGNKIVDFNKISEKKIINGDSFQLMAATNHTSCQLSSNKKDHFTGIVKLNDKFVCFDNLFHSVIDYYFS